jgi:autotransporter-associated beta strand protein
VGGKLKTSSNTFSPFFQNFGTNSMIAVASADGAEFCVTKNTSVTNGLVEVPSSTLSGHSAWNYSAADWLTAPAFKKTGDKTLTMSGTNTYKCATDVAAGTLALAGGENPGVLPTNGVTRVTGGTLDLGGNVQTVRALVGTAGSVVNGTLVAKEGIYPGGAGTVGSFTCGATLDGELHIDVGATGACDQIVAQGTLDVSNIDLVLPTSLPSDVIKLQVVAGATTGTFHDVENLPSGWEIIPKDTGLWAKKVVGTIISFR